MQISLRDHFRKNALTSLFCMGIISPSSILDTISYIIDRKDYKYGTYYHHPMFAGVRYHHVCLGESATGSDFHGGFLWR